MRRAFLAVTACAIALAGVAPEVMAAGAKRGPLVKIGDSQFGRVLFSGGHRALYLFTRDPRNKTRCYGDCAGVDSERLRTIERRDGRRQVTCEGQALHFYVHDPRARFCAMTCSSSAARGSR